MATANLLTGNTSAREAAWNTVFAFFLDQRDIDGITGGLVLRYGDEIARAIPFEAARIRKLVEKLRDDDLAALNPFA